ncbi:MAG TPA: hypothetical protein VFB20_04515 [Burkholderiales bacterium]|nr:hypothetical protein [Burkholderiales bacterium]
MTLVNSYVVDQLLIPFVALAFFVLAIGALAAGLGLIVDARRTFRVFGVLNRWVSTRRSLEPLERPHDIERTVQHHRRWFGAAFVAGGAFSIYGLVARLREAAVVSLLDGRLPHPFVAWMVGSARWFLVAGAAAAVVIGVLLIAAPRALSAAESRLDHWYSSRRFAEGADAVHLPLDRWVEKHPRVTGWTVLLGALAVVAGTWVLLFARH